MTTLLIALVTRSEQLAKPRSVGAGNRFSYPTLIFAPLPGVLETKQPDSASWMLPVRTFEPNILEASPVSYALIRFVNIAKIAIKLFL